MKQQQEIQENLETGSGVEGIGKGATSDTKTTGTKAGVGETWAAETSARAEEESADTGASEQWTLKPQEEEKSLQG